MSPVEGALRATRFPAYVAAVLLGGAALGTCIDYPTGPSDFVEEGSLAVVVTEPVLVNPFGEGSGGIEAVGSSGSLSFAGSQEVSFISYPPGSVPEADSIEVFNRATRVIKGAAMADGGVDPISIPSSVGDTLEITLLQDGTSIGSDLEIVPSESPPRVVRTRPGRRQTRVPLNSSMEMIFTEPIAAASTNAQNIRLLAGSQTIPATLIRSMDGTRIEVIPDQFLQPSTTYTLSLTTAVRDLSGERFQQVFSSDFTTIASGAPLVGALVFESKRSGQSEIWFMNDDGSDPIQLTRKVAGGWAATGPTLSPDGQRVVFSVWPDGEDWEIYLINVDGTGLTNLTNHPAYDGWRPAWSPDGSKISFFSTRDDPANDEIYVMNSDGSGVLRLTENPADDANSTWSPDGSKIAFETNRDGDFDIYVMNADGSDPRPLTTHPADDEWPAWSPDGSRIAFDSWRDGNREIYVMDSDGSNVVRLTFDEGQDSAPAWSRDGRKIAFVSGRGGSVNIWVMDPDGTGLVRLTDHPGADFFPSWGR